MTKSEVLRLAELAGFSAEAADPDQLLKLERFAALICEECALACDRLDAEYRYEMMAYDCAREIRALSAQRE